MTLYKKWDIVLVKFPFTNYLTTKNRPVLVISVNESSKFTDYTVVFITSKLDGSYSIGDTLIQNWEESKLPKPSMIKMKFATLNEDLISKKFGELLEIYSKLFIQNFKIFFEIN